MEYTERQMLRDEYRRYETEYLLALQRNELTDTAHEELAKELATRHDAQSPASRSGSSTAAPPPRVQTPAIPKVPIPAIILGVLMVLWGIVQLLITVGGNAAAPFTQPALAALPNWGLFKVASGLLAAAVAVALVVGGYRLVKRQVRVTLAETRRILWLGGPFASFVGSLLLPWVLLTGVVSPLYFIVALFSKVTPPLLVALLFSAYSHRSSALQNAYPKSQRNAGEA